MVIIFLLGECQQIISKNITKNAKDQEIIEQAKATAIKHLKNKYELDVEFTKAEMLPSYVAHEVILEGTVIGNKEQNFNISVNYKTNETSNFGMSPELVTAIRAKGYEPFIEKK
ncbi:hypothetical protein MNQ98_23260 [Paenibacillus sp. N3/727]|uniref:hypothetical protein n=1 Tax=Paenibacillus sp. N3/727 TaxID=2925845 RepID=UPI001F532176|nr:hypothetical protein [Paenibacillus sp. N3/727]UNK17366.1 hypothetical protein MNQ98_23260 [Paenibacillus sp. N3/727]